MRAVALGGRRLLLRVFFHGVFLLAMTAAVSIGLGRSMLRPSEAGSHRFGDWLGAQACATLTGPSGVTGVAALPMPVTVYRGDGSLVHSTVSPPMEALTADDLRVLRAQRRWRGGRVTALVCPGDTRDEYLLVGPPPSPMSVERAALLLLGVLLAVAVASIPLARSIAAPLDDVVAVTRAFGRGDLSARARVRRRDDIGDLAEAFNDMAARLEVTLRAEKEMLANISHELRTPLARIRVVLETAQENPARAQRLLGELGHDLADLERLVDDVMAAVRLNVGAASRAQPAVPLQRAPTDVGALVDEAMVRFRAMHPQRVWRVERASDLPRVMGDARWLRRLVDNLVDNACKYSDPTTTVRVTAKAEGDGVRLEVEDHGEGISPEDLPHVWTPFFRADRSRTRATGGVGLGLALARRIVDAHGGEVTLDSRVGEGTTVRVTLPADGAPTQTDTRA